MWGPPQAPAGAHVMAYGACIGCGKTFAFNPSYVPSVRVAGKKEPVCSACAIAANSNRIANGLEPITPHPQAYKPLPEEDLQYS